MVMKPSAVLNKGKRVVLHMVTCNRSDIRSLMCLQVDAFRERITSEVSIC